MLERAGHEVVQFDGPVLELLTDSRTRFDQRLAALGPDILAEAFDAERFFAPADARVGPHRPSDPDPARPPCLSPARRTVRSLRDDDPRPRPGR